ncbi:hypothetical protein I4F81_009645 [Pyropia yezoensis]|uniref:Uncharacterized protein n=1 Tax=Pyropia yezoensis TaxID=2788 RepID=A0ACC3CA63_PYRYE|nr:hypothetical protein I4F81_009645 [Neopyropia yezoensis]
MAGADIVTAEFGSDPAACSLVNRHVPSAAVPLASSTGGDAIFPEPDAPCDADRWSLAACAVDVAAATVTLEVDRPLAAANAAQDRPVVLGAGGGGGRQIVAAEAAIDAASDAGKLLHDSVLQSCELDEQWAGFVAGKSCISEKPQCRDVVHRILERRPSALLTSLFERADLLPGDRLELTGSHDTAKIDAAGDEPPITWGLGTA